jgi:hypothetical protein
MQTLLNSLGEIQLKVGTELGPKTLSAVNCARQDQQKRVFIAFALSQVLDESTVFDEDRINRLHDIVQFYFKNVIDEPKVKNIRFPAIQVLYLYSALQGIKTGLSPIYPCPIKKTLHPPQILRGEILGKVAERGIFKRDFVNKFFEMESDTAGIAREILNSRLDKNVPPTFSVDFPNLGKGTFQLFVADAQPIDIHLSLGQVPTNIRSVALALFSKLDLDHSNENALVAPVKQSPFLYCIDGAHILPRVLTGHRAPYLLTIDSLIPPLLEPFQREEEIAIENVVLEERMKFLKQGGIEPEAIRIHLIAVLILQEAIEVEGINLRDLLVLAYISNPSGSHSDVGALCGKETLLYEIVQEKNDALTKKIHEQFQRIIEIKESAKKAALSIDNPYPASSTLSAIWNYYRNY